MDWMEGGPVNGWRDWWVDRGMHPRRTHMETLLFGSSRGKVLKRKVNECVFVRPPVTQTSLDQRQLELGQVPAGETPRQGDYYSKDTCSKERGMG